MAGHSESHFEDAIEAHLLSAGWNRGTARDFDVTLGLDPLALAAFVQATQPKEWDKLVAGYGAATATKLGRRVADEIDQHGTIHVLRKGVKDRGASITLAFFQPTHGLTPTLQALYAANQLVIYRQVHHSESNAHQSLDLLLGLNGIPVATAELKNQFTGQNVDDAMAQYRDPVQRNPKDQVFARRCLAHFAVDPTLVFMTTQLAGSDTVFLPFNQGSGGAGQQGGKGNPANPIGHKSAYLWEQVWQRDNLLDLLHRYVQETPPAKGRKVLFPRYHQWDVVTRLVEHAGINGPGHSYLLQHSAGSGKSNSIAWLAHRLADLHTPSDPARLTAAAKDNGLAADQLVFHKVVVITDRTILDDQLKGIISSFDHVKGMLARIDEDSQQLKRALEDTQTKIIITTMQKFPVIANNARLGGKSIAIIVDEAHSSQSGEAAKSVKSVLGGNASKVAAAKDKQREVDDEIDGQDELAAHMEALTTSASSRGRQQNLSFFAFTATPKGKTLQLFGSRSMDAAGEATYRPFHLYSMRQAIEEGFILDVLANYITYRRYYRLANGLSSDDPEVEKGKAAAQLARYVDLHPSNLDQRAEIIVEHFRRVTATKIGGRGKAMVVSRSRLHAVRYHEAIKRYLKKHNIVGVDALVAFSGTVMDPDDAAGVENTESNMNGFADTQTPKRFDEDYQVLIVAEKYQTGFDQPLLHTMYVDKKLVGVKAVQTLSRLNRMHPGKTDTFILDFVNNAEQMREEFAPFFQSTWTEETDPNLLYNLQTRIISHAIIDPAEQRRAVQAFLQAKGQQRGAAHQTMWANITPAVDRFELLTPEDQGDLRDALQAYTRAYAFLGQVLPFTDETLESLFYYAKLLSEALPHDKTDLGGIDLGGTALQFIGHEAGLTGSGAVQVGDNDGEIATFSGEGRGGGQDPVLALLSSIIRTFNDVHGIDITHTDALMLFIELPSHLAENETVQRIAADNTEEQFGLTVKEDDVAGAIFDRQEASDRLLKLFTEDPRFAEEAMRHIRAATFTTARARYAASIT